MSYNKPKQPLGATGKYATGSTAANTLGAGAAATAGRTGGVGASGSPNRASRVIEEVKDGESSPDTDFGDDFDEEELS